MPKRLFARGIVMVALPVLLLQFLIVYLILERHWDRVTEHLSQTTAREIALLIAEGNQDKRQTLAKQLFLPLSWEPNGTLPPQKPISIVDFAHRTLRTELKKNIKNQLWLDTQNLHRKVDVRVAHKGGVVRIIVPIDRVYAEKTYQIILWIAATGIILMVIAILFLRNQVRPIQRLAVAAKRFGRGLEVPDFTPTGASEVREAGAAFLTMRDNLRAYIAQRTDMLSAISHDLRTAITKLKLQSALLPKNDKRDALEKDIENMEKMLLGYLDFARSEGLSTEKGEKPTLIDCARILTELAEPYEQVELQAPPSLLLRGRENAIRRALHNLIHNATAYGGRVIITARKEERGAAIVIDDDGKGIAPENYEEAFRPFVRLDEARNQNIVGTGLGLSIARDIIQAAGGTLDLAESPQGGLRVLIFLHD